MDFIDQIKQDMYSAMKSGDKIRTSILRPLLSSLKDLVPKPKFATILSSPFCSVLNKENCVNKFPLSFFF